MKHLFILFTLSLTLGTATAGTPCSCNTYPCYPQTGTQNEHGCVSYPDQEHTADYVKDCGPCQ